MFRALKTTAGLLLAGALLAQPALAETPKREGFTLTLNIGASLQSVQPKKSDGNSEVGLAGLNLGLGGFINPEMAVLFRISGSTTKQEVAPGIDATYLHGFAGPSLQYFVNDWLRLEAGLGMSIIRAQAEAVVFGQKVKFEGDDRGFGALLAAAATVWQDQDHQLYVGLELVPGFFDDGKVLTSSVVFGWQMF